MYQARARSARTAQVISLTIPFTRSTAASGVVHREDGGQNDDDSGDDVQCYICKSEFCDLGECPRSQTNLECCTQPICVGCLAKMAKRCTCAEDCDAVIVFCPFCREICPVGVSDIFLGACTKVCRRCGVRDAKLVAAEAPPPEPPEP
jgi:hypothetical protein